VGQALTVAAGVARTTTFQAENIARTLDVGFLDATALAEYITAKGVPFRQAHQVVGRLVARAEKDGKTLSELPLKTLQAACRKVTDDVTTHLGADNVVKRYASQGAAGARQLRRQLAFWKKALA